MSAFCPCPIGGSSNKRLVELSPFRDAGSGSEDGDAAAPATLADKAKGWLEMAAKPISTFRDNQAKAAAHAERVGVLKTGTTMKLLPDGRGSPSDVRISLASDGSMLTWSGQQGGSGVMALSAVRDIKKVTQTGIFSRGGDVPCQWMLVADDQSVRFEAGSEEEKQLWMDVLDQYAGLQSLHLRRGRFFVLHAARVT